MALLTEGALISEIRGSVGDRTFSRNAYGPYVKQKLIQTIRNTPKQIGRRTQLKMAVQSWQAFNDETRMLWSNWAKENPVRNSLGKKLILSGYNMYISAYLNKATVGALGIPFQPLKDRIPATSRGNIYGQFNPLEWEMAFRNGNSWFSAALYIGQQRPIANKFVNPSELKLAANTPANGFLVFEFETINNLMGFPTFIRDPLLYTPIGLKFIDIRSGVGSRMYIVKLQSVPYGKIY